MLEVQSPLAPAHAVRRLGTEVVRHEVCERHGAVTAEITLL